MESSHLKEPQNTFSADGVDDTLGTWLVILLTTLVAILCVKILSIVSRERSEEKNDDHIEISKPIGVVKDDYLHLYRSYISCNSTCAPLMYKKIINLVWNKRKNHTILDFLDSENLFSKSNFFKVTETKKREKWVNENKRQLGQKNLDGLDITFLHQLLSIVWYKEISKIGTPEQEIKLNDPKNIETLLHKVKELRNDLNHDCSIGLKSKFLTDLKSAIHDCMKEVCKLLGVDNYDEVLADIDQEFSNLIDDTTRDHNSRVKFIRDQLISICYDSLKRTHKNFSTYLPGSDKCLDSRQLFVNVNLCTSNSADKEIFPCTQLFKQMTTKIAVIFGDPGSGKTFLLKTLFREILNNNESTNFSNFGEIEMVLFISCRTDDYADLGQYMKAIFETQFDQFTNEEILDAIRLVDNLLFIIDGYDEVNDKSRKLVDSVIELCSEKSNSKCIISGRKKAASDLSEIILGDRHIEHDCFSIERISDKETKLRFLERYGSNLDACGKENLVDQFESLDESAQKEFAYPVLLALFFALISQKSEKIVIKTALDVYTRLYEFFEDAINEKLEFEGIPESQDVAREIMKIICMHSVKLCNKKTYYFIKSDYVKLMRDCKGVCSGIRSIENLLTGVLYPETSIGTEDKKSLHFHHGTIQEYFVAHKIVSAVERVSSNEYSLTEYKDALELVEDEEDENDELQRVCGREIFEDMIPYDSLGFYIYQNVNRMVILLSLAKRDDWRKKHFDKISSLMNKLMREIIIPNFEYCIQLIIDADYNESVIDILFNCADLDGPFSIKDERQLEALSMYMLHAKNSEKNLIYYLPLHLELTESHDKLKPLSDQILMNFDLTDCYFTFFKGCLDSEKSLKLVERKISSCRFDVKRIRAVSVFISVPSFSDHKLNVLNGLKAKLVFTVRYSEPGPGEEKYPLPKDSEEKPPTLKVVDAPSGSQENVFKIIKSLIPEGEMKMLFQLLLVRCDLDAAEVNQLLMMLYEEGIRTYSNDTKAIPWSDKEEYGYNLQLKNENFKRQRKSKSQKK